MCFARRVVLLNFCSKSRVREPAQCEFSLSLYDHYLSLQASLMASVGQLALYQFLDPQFAHVKQSAHTEASRHLEIIEYSKSMFFPSKVGDLAIPKTVRSSA